jgi:phenylpropionate dioxygenase-like ring-hydroxylating dioxygenase large terminal subunit
MRQAARTELGARLAGYVDTGTTYVGDTTAALPTAHYLDGDRWRAERDRLFRSTPVVVALSGQLPVAGDVATFDLPDLPTLTVRGDDGRARVFVNACRHRGVRLVDGPCHAGRTLVCPFHAWSYRTDGRLAAIADRSGFAGVDEADLQLRELPSVERYGFVWLLPDGHGDDRDPVAQLDAFLGAGLADELASYGLDTHRAFRSNTVVVEANWKLFYETFLEFYHGVYLHRSTLAHLMQRNVVHFDRLGEHWRMAAAKQSIRSVAGDDPSTWNVLDHAVVSYDVFPNLAVNMHGDHAAVYRIVPDARTPDRCTWHFTMLTPEPVEPGTKAERYFGKNFDYIVSTGEEDIAMAVSAQRTLAAVDRVLHGGFEPVLQWFHRRIDEELDRTR